MQEVEHTVADEQEHLDQEIVGEVEESAGRGEAGREDAKVPWAEGVGHNQQGGEDGVALRHEDEAPLGRNEAEEHDGHYEKDNEQAERQRAALEPSES